MASASARFTAVVDLPTPPLPEPMAMMLRTRGSGLRLGWTAWAAMRGIVPGSSSGLVGSRCAVPGGGLRRVIIVHAGQSHPMQVKQVAHAAVRRTPFILHTPADAV